MSRAASFGGRSVVLLALLLQELAWGQYIGVPGPGPVAPAPDSPANSGPSAGGGQWHPDLCPFCPWQWHPAI